MTSLLSPLPFAKSFEKNKNKIMNDKDRFFSTYNKNDFVLISYINEIDLKPMSIIVM